MYILKLNNSTVQFYDSIRSLPASRYNEYRKYLMIDSGLRSIEDVQTAVSELSLLVGNKESDRIEQNLLLGLHFAFNGYNAEQWAFVALIHSIDDEPLEQISEEYCMKVVERLSADGLSQELLSETLAELKKKSLTS